MNAARGQYAGATAKWCFPSRRTYSPSVKPYRLVKNQLARKTRSVSAGPDRPPPEATVTSALRIVRGLEPLRPLHAGHREYLIPFVGERSHVAGGRREVPEPPTGGRSWIAVDGQPRSEARRVGKECRSRWS